MGVMLETVTLGLQFSVVAPCGEDDAGNGDGRVYCSVAK